MNPPDSMSTERRAGPASRAASKTALLHLALTDGLTGLANRRAFDETLAKEWRRAARSRDSLGLLLLDIDYFKRFNDAYGHVAGDECLRAVAGAIGACVKRPGDLAARYGGEEFAAILYGTSADGAARLAQSICDAVHALAIPHRASSLGYVTVTIGVASFVPEAQDDPRTLVVSADEYLYAAKNAGRNRISGPDIHSSAPAAHAYDLVRHNLPREISSFIGRERQLEEIDELLAKHRLLTIVGSGGVGKTRVAIEAAWELVERFSDGAWLVELGSRSDPSGVATAIAQAIGVVIPHAGDSLAALGTAVRAKRLLLVLDNCEHLVEAVASAVSAILRIAPEISVLATSRQPLRVHGEVAYRLPSLDVPIADEAAKMSSADLRQLEAIALFIERAKDVNPEADTSDETLPAALDICRRLDGIPLAIELAAARTTTLSVERLRTMLDERFAVLTGGSRDALPRQQTLRALIDWSYDLLDEREQLLFRRLAVFPASFTVNAAALVCADDALTASEVRETLESLIEQSLLIASEPHEPRYRLLESTRAYARDKLNASGERDALHDAHLAMVRGHFEEAAAEYNATLTTSVLERLASKLDDARAALDWAIDRGDDESAVKIFLATRVWEHLGLHREAISISKKIAGILDGENHERRARFWGRTTLLLIRAADYRSACEAVEFAVESARSSGVASVLAEALVLYGEVLTTQDRLDEASAALDSAESVAAPPSQQRDVRILMARGGIAFTRGDLSEAASLYERNRDLCRSMGFERGERTALGNLADTDHARGETRRAISGVRELLRLMDRDPFGRATCLSNLSGYLAAMDDADGSMLAGVSALEFFSRQSPDGALAAGTIAHLALASALTGDFARAARLGAFAESRLQQGSNAFQRTEMESLRRLRDVLQTSDLSDDALRALHDQGSKLGAAAAITEAATRPILRDERGGSV